MESSFLRNYAIAFLLTIGLEISVALLLGYRKRIEIACVFWINVFTHPLLNYLLWIINAMRSEPLGLLGVLSLEIGVVLIEWRLLCYALPCHRRSRLLVLSLTMNSVSYGVGVLLVWLRIWQPG
jgi:hypothetical protein